MPKDSIKTIREDMNKNNEKFLSLLQLMSSKIEGISSSMTKDTVTVSTPSNEVSSSTSKTVTSKVEALLDWIPKRVMVSHPSNSTIYKETGVKVADTSRVMIKFAKRVPKGSGVETELKEIASSNGGTFHYKGRMQFPNETFKRNCPTISFKQPEIPQNVLDILGGLGMVLEKE
jgi:hypothetical protein